MNREDEPLNDMPSAIAEYDGEDEDDTVAACNHQWWAFDGESTRCMDCGATHQYVRALTEARKIIAAWAEEGRKR